MGRKRWFVPSTVVLLMASGLLLGAARSAPPEPTAAGQSDYWLVAGGGSVFPFGTAMSYQSTAAGQFGRPVVGAARTPSGDGYWLVAPDGAISAVGDAGFHGDAAATRLALPVVGMAPTVGGSGYWLVAGDGGVFTFGDAGFHGSAAPIRLNRSVVAMAATPSGGGYWLVAGDGGVFAFGDARFLGSTAGLRLNRPVVGMAATPSGSGYWLVAGDGGVFAFGDAAFYGSAADVRLNRPVVAMATTVGWDGYWLAASDGGIFTFGTAAYSGSTAGRHFATPIVSVLPAPPSAAVLLEQLPVAPERPRTGYDRSLFRYWVDPDQDGCDTRAEVLKRQSRIPPTVQAGCRIVSGDWVSGYDSTESRDPDSLAVDHTVPLAEAWESGADRWDADRREAYANDLGYPHALVAVTTPSGRAEGDQDPTEWKPRRDLWCDYAAWWITVKVRWRLTADQAEVDTLHSMLDSCRGGLSTTTTTGTTATTTGPTTTTTGPTTTTTTGPTTTTTVPPAPEFGAMQCDAPGGPDDAHNINDEWVQLVNPSTIPAPLGDWTVSDAAANTYTIPPGYILGPNGTVTLHTGHGTDSQTDLYWGRAQHVWNNDGDTAHLLDPHDHEVAAKAC